jgi:hypothetical protein
MARPRDEETKARTREFLRLISVGIPGREAARSAKIDPERALDVLTHPHGREALLAAKAA